MGKKVERLPEGRGLRVAALMNLIKVAYATMVQSGERRDAHLRPHYNEVVISTRAMTTVFRSTVNSTIAGMVKCDLGEHSAGASFDYQTARSCASWVSWTMVPLGSVHGCSVGPFVLFSLPTARKCSHGVVHSVVCLLVIQIPSAH